MPGKTPVDVSNCECHQIACSWVFKQDFNSWVNSSLINQTAYKHGYFKDDFRFKEAIM